MQLLSILALLAGATLISADAIKGMHYIDGKRPASKRGLHRRAKLNYFGGPVISNVEVHPIFYGPAVADTAGINGFYAGVTDSPYFDWLSEYNTPTQTIGRGTAAPGISVAGSNSTNLDDSDIKAWLRTLVVDGTIVPNNNTYYPIHFDPKYSITMQGDQSCVIFCAYHGTIDISDISGVKYMYYGVLPDQYVTGCKGGCGFDPTPFNNLCSVASHELIEAVTDAAVGVATVIGPPLAWYDNSNGEIGDICNASQGKVAGGDGVTYTVQKEWSNAYGACIDVPNGPPPPPTTSTTAVPQPCSHSVCTQGAPLTADCGSCAAAVDANDSYCGIVFWDSICVNEVAQYCPDVNCGAAPTAAVTRRV